MPTGCTTTCGRSTASCSRPKCSRRCRSIRGCLRLKADVLQQVESPALRGLRRGAHLQPHRRAAVLVPDARTCTIDDMQTPLVDPFTGQPLIDPQTGEPVVEHQLLATSRNNFIYRRRRADLLLAADRDRPEQADVLPRPDQGQERPRLRHAGLSRLGPVPTAGHREPAAGHRVDPLDRLSERARAGPGDELQVQRRHAVWHAGPVSSGFIDAWGIHDDGHRQPGPRACATWRFPIRFRGRVLGQHRQYLPGRLAAHRRSRAASATATSSSSTTSWNGTRSRTRRPASS